jgi:membrane associated rhomboid family serine protease
MVEGADSVNLDNMIKNSAGLEDLLFNCLTEYFSSNGPARKVLFRQDMGAVSLVNFIDATPEMFNVLIRNTEAYVNRRSEGGRSQGFTYLIYFFDDIDEFAFNIDVIGILKQVRDIFANANIYAEQVLIDYKTKTYKVISGEKLPDRKLESTIRMVLENCGNPDFVSKKSYRYERQGRGIAKPSAWRQSGVKNSHSSFMSLYVIIGINVLVFLLGNLLFYIYGSDPLEIWGIKDNYDIMSGQVWRLVTCTFLHENLMHILGNMYFLLYLGRIIVQNYGGKKFLILYFISGLVGSLASFMFLTSDSLGASGAIMGLGGALVFEIFFAKNRAFRQNGYYINIILLVAFNLLYGIFDPSMSVDNFGHFGGFIGGFLVAFVFLLLGRKEKRLS